MKKFFRIALLILAILFVAIQFRRPERVTIETITADHIFNRMAVPANIRAILSRSCFDCHSDQTDWPWYSGIAPVSWLVAGDVERGRKKMNFSAWGKLALTRQSSKLDDIADEVKKGEMPLKIYLLMHPDANLSQADRAALSSWAGAMSDSLGGGDKDE